MLARAVSSPKIANDYVAALVALLATLAGLYVIGGIVNPELFGISSTSESTSQSQ